MCHGLPSYDHEQLSHHTPAADALNTSAYLSGTHTRRVRRALAALLARAVAKDTVSCVRRQVQIDWQAWNERSLAHQPIVRQMLDGNVVRVRLDQKATSISHLVAIGEREDLPNILLSITHIGGETTASWRAVSR